jgi:hypothetical protein
MIPIIEAIETGAWLKVVCDIAHDYRCSGDAAILEFRLRLREFKKLDYSAYPPDESEKIDTEANIWVLKMDIVNLYKNALRSDLFGDILDMKDEDGYVFGRCKDTDIILNSSFSEPTGLKKFFCSNLPPKIKKTGAFAYELPEEFEGMCIFACYRNAQMMEV